MSHPWGYSLLSATLAAAATLFDLDRQFLGAGAGSRRVRASIWWWGFVVANGVVAAVVYLGFASSDVATDLDSWGYAVVVGLGYLAVLRLKIATVSIQGHEVPVGIEAFYEAARQFVFRQVNRLVKEERRRQAEELVDGSDIRTLGNRVRVDISTDALLSLEEKHLRLEWLLSVLQDPAFDEDQKKVTLAIYLTTGAHI